MLGSTKNSIDATSSSSVSLVEASLAKALAFALLDRGMTSIEAVGIVFIKLFAVSK